MKENLLKTSRDFISFLYKKRFVLAICAIITLVFGLLNIFVFSNHSEALDSDTFNFASTKGDEENQPGFLHSIDIYEGYVAALMQSYDP